MILRFATVGVLNNVIDWSLFLALTAGGAAPVAANLASYGSAILASFVLNRSWTFAGTAQRGALLRQGAGFLILNLAGLGLSTLLVWAGSQAGPPILAKAMATGVILALNYVGYRFVVFR
jgi:putative flippase GtrA